MVSPIHGWLENCENMDAKLGIYSFKKVYNFEFGAGWLAC